MSIELVTVTTDSIHFLGLTLKQRWGGWYSADQDTGTFLPIVRHGVGDEEKWVAELVLPVAMRCSVGASRPKEAAEALEKLIRSRLRCERHNIAALSIAALGPYNDRSLRDERTALPRPYVTNSEEDAAEDELRATGTEGGR